MVYRDYSVQGDLSLTYETGSEKTFGRPVGLAGLAGVSLTQVTSMCNAAIIDLYERHARAFDRDRSRSLLEQAWLDRFLGYVPPKGIVLDVGCGMAEPIARYIIEAGFSIVGIDSSPSMIDMCRERFPTAEWLVADMRHLALGRRFDGLLAWDSFFHLPPDDQRGMFTRFSAHALPAAPLLFTSGPSEGEAIGSICGERLYHASLEPSEFRRLLTSNGFSVRAHRVDDSECGDHTVWLATQEGGAVTRRKPTVETQPQIIDRENADP